MNPLILLVGSTLLIAGTWETLVGAVPYGIKFGIISLVFCLAAILIQEIGMGRIGGSLRISINKYVLAFIFGTSLTWFGGTILGLSIETCYCIAAAVGLTIEIFAPWIQKKAFVWLKKVFKS